MRKIGFVLALIVLLAGVSVEAQKKSPRPRFVPPTVEVTNIVIQDDHGGGSLIIDPVSGAYKCKLCEYDYALSGVGVVEIRGCDVFFSDVQKGYRMFASMNMCTHEAKTAIEVFSLETVGFDIEPVLEYWADSDMRDSTAECAVEVKKK